MAYITLTPAYGRDYKNKKEVLADWHNNKDFLITDMSDPYDGSYMNKEQAKKGNTYNIRYNKLRSILPIKA